MQRSRYFILGVLLALAGGAAAVTTGGVPYLPYFGGINVGRAPNGVLPGTIQLARAGGPSLFLYDSTRSANQHYAQLSFTSGALLAGTCPDSLSGCSTADLTPADSGAVAWSFQTGTSNCSVSGTNASVSLHRIGKLVVGVITASGSCTTAATATHATTNAPVPAAFRPTLSQSCSMALAGNNFAGYICVNSSGNFSATILSGTSTTFLLQVGQTFTYTLD
jgi:hypothetical protein